jgi:hypothetical protein
MLAEKCSSSSFLPRTPSAFQQARRRALHRTLLLGRAAIFGHEENNGLQDGRAAPVGREEMEVRNRRVSSTRAWLGRWSRRSEISSRGEVEDWVGTTKSGTVGLAVAVFTLAAAFFFVFPAAGLVAAVDFGLGFLGPAVFLVAVTLGCDGASVTG